MYKIQLQPMALDVPPCSLEFEQDEVRLTDPRGFVLARFPRRSAEQRIQLPSFLESRRNILIVTDQGRVAHFRPDRATVRELKRTMNAAVAAEGTEAIAALEKAGKRDLAAGIGFAGLGLVTSALSLAFPQRDFSGGGQSFIYYGLVLVGVIETVRGLVTLARVRRIRKETSAA